MAVEGRPRSHPSQQDPKVPSEALDFSANFGRHEAIDFVNALEIVVDDLFVGDSHSKGVLDKTHQPKNGERDDDAVVGQGVAVASNLNALALRRLQRPLAD